MAKRRLAASPITMSDVGSSSDSEGACSPSCQSLGVPLYAVPYPLVRIKCPVCTCTFNKFASLKEHATKHKYREEDFEHFCASCGKTWPLYKSVLSHHRHCKGPATIGQFCCPHCPKTFSAANGLASHIGKAHKLPKVAIDQSIFPHVCFLCGAMFKDQRQLTRHYNDVHVKPLIEPTAGAALSPSVAVTPKRIKCEYCRLNYKDRRSLLRHMKKKHAGKPYPPVGPPAILRSPPSTPASSVSFCSPGAIPPAHSSFAFAASTLSSVSAADACVISSSSTSSPSPSRIPSSNSSPTSSVAVCSSPSQSSSQASRRVLRPRCRSAVPATAPTCPAPASRPAPSPPLLSSSSLQEVFLDDSLWSTPFQKKWRPVLSSLYTEVNRPWSDIEASSESIIEELASLNVPIARKTKTKPAEQPNTSGKTDKERPRRSGRRYARRKSTYKRHQLLFRHKRKALAEELLAGTSPDEKKQPPLDACVELFQSLWGDGRPCSEDFSSFPNPSPIVDTSITVLSREEVLNMVRRNKNRTSPGPDGITAKTLKMIDRSAAVLSALFNLWLARGRIPSSLRRNCTILLPKTDEKPELAGSWRPITIGSLVLRTFNKVLTRRLWSLTTLCPRQKGFVPGHGVHNNIVALDKMFRVAKAEKRTVAMTLLDVRKAFDTVPHDTIGAALRRLRVPALYYNIIMDQYKQVSTNIRCGNSISPPIDIKRGVKQGDPLSPLLFDMIMDPLMHQLVATRGGFDVGEGSRMNCLAYADDVCLVTYSSASLQQLVSVASNFYRKIDLQLNASKSAAFLSAVINGSRELIDPQVKVEGALIPVPTEVEYLGFRFCPRRLSCIEPPSTKLKTMIDALNRGRLKPSQKLLMLNAHILPKFKHALPFFSTMRALHRHDRLIRRTVRKWLKLPTAATNRFMYAPVRWGGLGIDRLEATIQRVRASLLDSVLDDDSDQTMLKLLQSSNTSDELTGLRNKISAVGDWRNAEFDAWASFVSQGHGIACFQQSETNTWIRGQAFSREMREGNYLRALGLRVNLAPLREPLQRGPTRTGDITCRLCRQFGSVETIAHVVNGCPAMKLHRIRRHHVLCGRIAEAAKPGWKVTAEPSYLVDGRQLRPDLVFEDENSIVVLDVTVRYEHDTSCLANAYKDKIDHYEPLAEHLRAANMDKTVVIHGIPVGSRGGWYRGNDLVLQQLCRAPKALRDTLIARSVESSAMLISTFNLIAGGR